MVEPKILERDLEAHFSKECRKYGVATLKLNVRFSRGWPDRLVIKNSRVGLAELKTVTGKLSELQVRVHAMLEEQGVHVEVLRTKEQITNYLKDFGLCHQ